MATVYFLGAGASAADGIPTTPQLNYGVAKGLREYGKRAGHLRTYYKDLYGVTDAVINAAARRWDQYLPNRDLKYLAEHSGFPDLIETLSLIDVCIGEDQSLGMSSMRNGRRGYVEMNPGFLRRARQQLTFAIGRAVQSASYNLRAQHTRRLVASVNAEDTIISTNWDMLVDRCFVSIRSKLRNSRWLTQSPVRYHCVGERPVDWRGNDIGTARNARSVLRLHGAINWFGCACCGTVYVNLGGSYIMDELDRRPDYDDCHCGAGLLTTMVAPSYLKDYRSVSLRSVWREAQKRLEAATQWVFIGYSLPSDDFHIRAMLMRALRSRPQSRPQTKDVQVFLRNDGAGQSARARFVDFFRVTKPDIRMTGFAGFTRP
jgi:NAD-dependent SIR2 family protein deacetylase